MTHTWQFQRAGGFDQVVIATAADLEHLHTLDQKLWVALACPVRGNNLDAASLAMVDSDNDGRIRAPELLAAIDWCRASFHNLDAVLESGPSLPLASIADASILASAKRVLRGLGKPEAADLTVEEAAGAAAVLNAMPFNGDGILPAASVEDAEVRATLEAVLTTCGSASDRSGAEGIGTEQLTAFFEAATAYNTWWERAQTDEDTVVPLGAETAPAVEAFVAVKAKVEDFFTRSALATFDPRSTSHLVGAETSWESLAPQQLTRDDTDVAAFPLALIGPSSSLPLSEGLNPAWRAKMEAFRTRAVEPLLGPTSELSSDQWNDLRSRFAAYEAWLSAKEGAAVEPLGIERIQTILASNHKEALEALIARDASRKPEADALQSVERAARYHRDLLPLVRNFVSFRDFYRPDRVAMFQAGVLYLDGRSCDLVLQVDDIAKHSTTAGASYAFIAYCECHRKATGEKMSLAAAFTDGDSDFLAVGRNGLFYDRKGQDWDATITKVVEQPISIRQAFWAPYKRAAKFVSDQLEKFAAEQDKAASTSMTANLESPATAATQAFDIGKFAGIFAAVGLASGLILSTLTMLVSGFLSLPVWQMPVALGFIILLISGPSMLLAAFKLRNRNLAPMLDASGWAVNARARINIPFGESLTSVASLPSGSKRNLIDPYADRGSLIGVIVFLILLLCALAFAHDKGLIDTAVELAAPEVIAE